MSIAIELRFPAGRYHATPWGRHVNEGVPEWPPSPWRLLRALVAVWKRTAPHIPEEQVRRILEALSAPPLFNLPRRVNVAHTRHYMPWEKKGPDDRTLVFDTFVCVPRDEPVIIHWPAAALAAADQTTLQNLLHNLAILGRAEGWIEATLSDKLPDAECIRPTQAEDRDLNPVPVLCAEPASAFTDEHYPRHDPKKLRKGDIKIADCLFDAPRWHLCLDTETIHQQRWPSVPGAQWVNYKRPPTLNTAPVTSVRHQNMSTGFTVARFLLDGPVLPRVTDTVRVAEQFRAALMSRFNCWCQQHESQESLYFRKLADDGQPQFSSPTLSGKDKSGQPLQGHVHAYYLPTPAIDGDRRRITQVTLCASPGFSPQELAAIQSLRRLRLHNDLQLSVQLVGLGTREDFTAPLLRTSTVWESVTPFVGHSVVGNKSRRSYLIKTIKRDWRKLIKANSSVDLVEVMELDASHTTIPAREFCRSRRKHSGEGFRPCGYFRLQFSSAVSGPLALGYASHFGLGLFQPAE